MLVTSSASSSVESHPQLESPLQQRSVNAGLYSPYLLLVLVEAYPSISPNKLQKALLVSCLKFAYQA